MPNPKRPAVTADDPDPKRRALHDPVPERRAGEDPDPERRRGDDPDPDPKRRRGDAPDGASPNRLPDGGDPSGQRTAMAYGGGAEGWSTEDKVEKVYAQKEVAMDITERKEQIETICLQMQETASFLTKINASQTALLMEREDTANQISVLCDNLSKIRTLLVEIRFDMEPKEQIETICLQMQETASFLTKINASQPALLMEREDIPNQISALCDNLSKFRTVLVEIGFDAAGSKSSMKKKDLVGIYAANRMREMQEEISKKEKIRIRDQLQLIPLQEPEEYMHEYYRLHPHQEEETKLTRSLKKQIAEEESLYATYRRGRKGLLAGSTFEAESMISPMHFTFCPPGVASEEDVAVTTGTSLEIFSIKIAQIKGDLNWPLYVYGVVAARDRVDFNRNILFNRMRNNAQKVTEADPFLCLTGPARAILPEVEFEVELMVKGRTKSCDRALIYQAYPYIHSGADLYSIGLHNCLCEIKLSLQQLVNSVQATIIAVQIVNAGTCTFKYGGRVACSLKSNEAIVCDSKGFLMEDPPGAGATWTGLPFIDPPGTQVVLLDSRYCDDGEMPMSTDGYLDLMRRVVSVELPVDHFYYPEKLEETLKVQVEAYSESGVVSAKGHVKFTPKLCNISKAVCDIGDSKVEITVAWSVHVVCKT
ncbi:uncharacterized protein LOC119308254 [Triticum dicoccoides]|uniref:uncharacterized protein LOC119308254 n=1 Tax=Triticum dicoccoides TaxID=85692 RepID=UPI00188E6DB7|nr:uncharacterized protein LOC119308254 [Triticum dicoccoides]